MTSHPPVGFLLPPQDIQHHLASGIREPIRKPHPQQRRSLNEWICFLVTRGNIQLLDEIDGIELRHQIEPGSIHIIPPNTWQQSIVDFPIGSHFAWFHFSSSDNWQWLQQQSALDQVDKHLKQGHQDQWLIPYTCDISPRFEDYLEMHQELMHISERWSRSDAGADAILKHFLFRLHQDFSRQLVEQAQPKSNNSDERHARQAQWLIREHYQQLDSLSAVAAELQLDPAYVARCCKNALGQSVGDMILEQRIRAAQQLLKNDQYNLKEIAYHCGFSSLNYFCRRFKQRTGQTPKTWRQQR